MLHPLNLRLIIDWVRDAAALGAGRASGLLRDSGAARARTPHMHIAGTHCARRAVQIPPPSAPALAYQTWWQVAPVRLFWIWTHYDS